MNQWAANGGKQEEERYGQFWELSGQGEQRCSELFEVCLRDSEDCQTGENCRSHGKDRNKSFCGICRQKMTDGTDAAEFKTG